MPPSHVAPPEPAVTGSLHLRLCQAPEVVLPTGQQLPLAPRDAALLAWLALEGPTPRARLATLLWPDSGPEAARNALRQRLHQLRRQLPDTLLNGQNRLALGETVTHDLHGGAGLLEAGDIEIAGEFGQWLAQQRERRHSRTLQGLAVRADSAEAAQDWPTALALAQELLALRPLSEEAHQRLIRLHYLAGDRAAALLAFDRCEKLLKDEVGARPSAATLALLATVEGSGSAAAPPPPLAGVPPSVLRPPRLFGRDSQVLALAEGWAAAQVVALIGEAGMGKSRLFQEFATLHPGTVHVAARPGDMGVPFATLARLLRAVAARPQASALLDQEPATRHEVARVVPELAGGTPTAAGEGQRLVLQGALARLLRAQPALAGLLVDDLHFADEASLEMLLALLGDEPAQAPGYGPRWALAWRPAEAATPLHGFADALAEQAALRPVPLLPLSEADLAALVDSLGLPGVRGSVLAAGLHQRTGGNPLFVLETLKQAWVEGRLRDGANPAGGTALALPRPVSVTRLIERRVGQLSAGALALARVAAIAGVDFGVPLAEHVLQVPAMRLADAITELEAAQVLRGNQFAHDLVADAVHGGVPVTVARHTHAQVALWLQTHGGEPARVAGHWIAAGQPLQALPALQQAAEAARGAVRHREFIRFLETKARIEEEAGRLQEAFDSLLPAARERTSVGVPLGEGLATCDRLDRLACTPRQRVQAGLLRAGVHALAGSTAGLADGLATLAAARTLGDERLTMHMHSELAKSYTVAGDCAHALYHESQCMAWFEAHGSLQERANGHGGMALALDNLGRGDEARPHHARALALALQAGDLQQASVAAANHARNHVFAGDLETADRSFAQSAQLLGAYEHQASHLPMVRLLRAMVLSQLGRHEEALDHAEGAIEAAQAQASAHLDLARLRLAVCWWQLGQWARVKQTLALLPEPTQSSLAVRVGQARLAWAYALAHGTGGTGCQQTQQGLQGLQSALAALAEARRPDLRLPLLLELAGAAAGAEPAEAVQQARQVAEQAITLGYRNVELAARLRAAELATPWDPGQARREALAARDLHRQGVRTTAWLPAATWLLPAQALAAAGDRAHAAEVAAEGRAWLLETVARHVATPWRAGFLEHNPVNRELLALASRLA